MVKRNENLNSYWDDAVLRFEDGIVSVEKDRLGSI